ncbi:MAG: hypothetical protein QM778_00680 [Myxococcales bacterium]
MNALPPQRFTRITHLPVDLTHVRDLDEFDGPLLSEFRSSKGETYLYKWCDSSAEANRWMVVRTPPAQLLPYLLGKVTLRTVIEKCLDQFVYLVDMDGNADALATYYGLVADVPPSYLPSAKSYFVAASDVFTGGPIQDVYVGESWDYQEQLSLYPRKYLQAHAFLSLFGSEADLSAVRDLRLNYNLKGGWVFHHVFEKMKGSAATRGRLIAAGVASPGYLRFEVDPRVASQIRTSVHQYLQQGSKLRPIFNLLVEWSNGHVQVSDDAIKSDLLVLCETLCVNTGQVLAQADDLEQAVKIVTSYVRRIQFLATQEVGLNANILGLPSDDKD